MEWSARPPDEVYLLGRPALPELSFFGEADAGVHFAAKIMQKRLDKLRCHIKLYSMRISISNLLFDAPAFCS
jgi:hypothetical protein